MGVAMAAMLVITYHPHRGPALPHRDAVVAPTVLVIALLAAFAEILVIRLAGTFRGGETAAGRLAACCDVAMAAAMGYMLVAFL